MLLHKVCRAAHPKGATVEHVGVDHGGAHILMAKELLDRSDVLSPFQQVGRKGVAEGVATSGLAHSGFKHGTFHGFLHHARIQMMTALGA
jgi:hypothetical protein